MTPQTDLHPDLYDARESVDLSCRGIDWNFTPAPIPPDEGAPAMYEFAYARSLEAIAMGETRDYTREYLVEMSDVSPTTFERAAADALPDALYQGVLREDIDPSWFS